jgi:hypothetical protein
MLLADRGYDADWIRELAIKKGAWANIPPKSNRSNPICFSPYLFALATRSSGSSTGSNNVVGSDALRQARRQPPCLRSTRVNQAMAALL